MAFERKPCTADNPAPREGGPEPYRRSDWYHPDAKAVGEEYNGLSGGGDYDIYECPHCKRTLYVELPD
jgi:hypothetical protein